MAQVRGSATLCLSSFCSGNHWCSTSSMRIQGTHSPSGNTEAQLPAVARLEDMGVGALTLHGILHVLGKQIPHHFSTDFTHIQFLGKPGKSLNYESMKV